MGTRDSDQQQRSHDRGKNLGQGLGNITDKQRRDLAGTGDDAPTKDQRRAERSGHQEDSGRGSGH